MTDRTTEIEADLPSEKLIRKQRDEEWPDRQASDRPTQADLAAIMDGRIVEKWDDPEELAIHALVHRAWVLEIERKGGSASQIGSEDIRALRMAQAAIRLVPARAIAQ